MLRLCYDLNRYSTDLDFWFTRKTDGRAFFEKVKKFLGSRYELTDAAIKFNTLLFEMRSQNYPIRLKVEIRKGVATGKFQEAIAYSKYGSMQVALLTLTPDEALKRKIAAALDRKDIRDFFDIEFLMRKGAAVEISPPRRKMLVQMIKSFKPRDFSVTLGSVLDADTRRYYAKAGFDYLLRRLST